MRVTKPTFFESNGPQKIKMVNFRAFSKKPSLWRYEENYVRFYRIFEKKSTFGKA